MDVTDDQIREAIARKIDDPLWKPQDTANIVIHEPDHPAHPGRWESPGLDTIRGYWYIDGPEISILIWQGE